MRTIGLEDVPVSSPPANAAGSTTNPKPPADALVTFGITIAVLALAFLAASCGSSGGGSTTSATETWASGVCTSITTWQSAMTSAADAVKGDPTPAGLQTAAANARSATATLASDLKGLGTPSTQAGQQAKQALDGLAANLQHGASTIETATQGVSGASDVLIAATTVAGALVTMGTEVKTTFTELQGADANAELKDAFAGSSACKSLTGGGS